MLSHFLTRHSVIHQSG
uniref:Uncharacterized protein n=1 Tax=Arundo donax TaxID=35708 RepID=A0A0A9BU68_ARUDO